MQVGSQTCSCTEKDRQGRLEGGMCGIKPESAALLLPRSLSAHTATQTETQPSFLGLPSFAGEVCFSFPPHFCMMQDTQRAAAATTRTFNWPFGWAVRAANIFQPVFNRFSRTCYRYSEWASTSHIKILRVCPCPYHPTEMNLHFPVSSLGCWLIKNSTHDNRGCVSEAWLPGERCSQEL